MIRLAALVAALLLGAAPLLADARDAAKVVLGDDAKDCNCPTPDWSPTASPTITPTATPSPSATPTPDPMLDAVRNLGFKATWESPGVLLVTLSDESARFDIRSADLKPEATERIKKLSNLLIQFPGNGVRVDGHTDQRGGRNFNMELSRRRAQAVRDVMVQQGVALNLFEAVEGWAWDKPVNIEGSEDAMAENRRVEVRVKYKRFELIP